MRTLPRLAVVLALCTAVLACRAGSADAAAAMPGAAPAGEPSGPHPRLFSDAETTAGFKARAATSGSYVARTLRHCDEVAANPATYANDTYMGFDWAQSLQSCLVAWRATGRDAYARTAMIYFKALLDDLKTVGDGKGGDEAARRDSGYAIRMLGPYTALAYDWLHDHPLMTEELRARARQRFRAWTDWYLASGYRARSPGSNYNAAYVYAATLIAIAEGGEGGEDSERLWRHVSGTLLQKDLLPAIEHGLLRGGDWSEGWQYAPLSVASYSLALRAAQPYGIDTSGVPAWLRAVLLRHLYGLAPDGLTTYVGGDTESEMPNVALRRDTLAAVVAGIAAPDVKQWAQSELNALAAGVDGVAFVSALADAARVTPQPFPRDGAAQGYYAAGSQTLYWRSGWKSGALWFVSPCAQAPDTDHWHNDAGNFVLTRGADALVVDPSPYGTQSTLTGNGPTIDSPVLPAEYAPSQGYWGHRTGFRWAAQLASGELLARCDYADQYRLQGNDSDMTLAVRDFVLLPYVEAGGGDSAALLVFDRAQRRDGRGTLHLRVRTEAPLKPAGTDVVRGTAGRSQLRVARLAGGDPASVQLRTFPKGDCFGGGHTRGNCEAARFPVSEWSWQAPGGGPVSVMLLDAAGARSELPPEVTPVAGQGVAAWALRRGTTAWTVGSWRDAAAAQFDASPGRLLLLPDTVAGVARAAVTASPVDGKCRISLRALPASAAAPAGATVLAGQVVALTLTGECGIQPLAAQSFLDPGQ